MAHVHVRVPEDLLRRIDEIADEKSKATGILIDRPTAIRGVLAAGVQAFTRSGIPA